MKHVAEWPATATGCCYVACLCSFCSFIFVNDVCTPAVALKEDSTAVQLARSAVNRPVSLANNLWTSLSDQLHRDMVFLARKNSMEPGRYLGVCQKLIGNRQTSSYENSFWVVSLWRCCNLYGGEMRNLDLLSLLASREPGGLMESNSVLSWVAWILLWSPYVIGQTIIFSSCGFFFFFLSIFFPRLISAVGDWMSNILPHMVWP